ncbi:MAG: cytochrome c biogenesis protein CcdA [Candidatus Eisenbacteria bacterium]
MMNAVRAMREMCKLATLSTLLLFATLGTAFAQFGGGDTPAAEKLVKVTAEPLTLAAGARATIVLHLSVEPGWHVNANPPALEYNIPTTIAIVPGSGLTPGKPHYPAGKSEKFEFEETPLTVYDGTVEITVPLTAAADAKTGVLQGTVEFQSCNNQVCLAPAKVTFTVPVTVQGVADAATIAAAGTAAAADAQQAAHDSASFSTAAPAGGSASTAARNKLEEALAKGGFGWFLALFVGGLLLNLTPCVFPMLGITVSIFGARAKQPLPKVLTTAILYVLGICVTYTALGVVAALTGGLFGSALQSVWVNLVLGGLMLVLSLGMFGVYEMQPPTWVMDKLGGAQATSFAGAFFSGLGVGVIAAPCVGPFVVAVLALVAQKGDVGFGVRTMFTLSLGLGFPYLFLATFSNLLQTLPRSGDWMVWVKHAFGTLMVAFGLFYLTIGFAPAWSPWVLPLALGIGGLWLGFIDHSAGKKGAFKMFTRIVGAVALFAGVVIGTEMYMAAARTMTWKDYEPAAVAASVAAGRPVMLDFSADWCVPCHELELNTFSDERVVAAGRQFDRYHVDLTKYDSPQSEATRKQYGITGVPTIVFLDHAGQEIADARVEGFMPPEPFLSQMKKGGGK